MKRTLVLVALALLACTLTASAATATGTLAVTATVQSSLAVVFDTNTNGVTLGADGTSAATLAFGTVSAFAAPPTNVTVSQNSTPCLSGTCYGVSTPVWVKVEMSGTTSPNAILKAQLQTADTTNAWLVGGTQVTTTAATINGTFPYNTDATEIIAIQIPYSNAETSVSNTITFTATSN